MYHSNNNSASSTSSRTQDTARPQSSWNLTTTNANSTNPKTNDQVIIHVYDITNGSLKNNSFGLLDGIWHTGIEVFGNEYFFCKHGVLTCIPKEYEVAKYHHSIPMGESKLSEPQFKRYLEYYKGTKYCGKNYREIVHNCNNFTEEMSYLLVGVGIPDDSVFRM